MQKVFSRSSAQIANKKYQQLHKLPQRSRVRMPNQRPRRGAAAVIRQRSQRSRNRSLSRTGEEDTGGKVRNSAQSLTVDRASSHAKSSTKTASRNKAAISSKKKSLVMRAVKNDPDMDEMMLTSIMLGGCQVCGESNDRSSLLICDGKPNVVYQSR